MPKHKNQVQDLKKKKIPEEEKFNKQKFLSSRKFVAYLVAVNVGLIGFIVLYYHSKDIKLFIEYLDFVLWSLVAYTGGNAVNKLSERLRK